MIHSETDLSDREVDACRAVAERLDALLGSKVLSQRIPPGGRDPGPGTVTPAVVRAMVRQSVAHLPRAEELETFLVRRLQVNGMRFEEWEIDPTRIVAML